VNWKEKLVDAVLGTKSADSLEKRTKILEEEVSEAERRAASAVKEYELRKRIAKADTERREALRGARSLSRWSTQKLLKWTVLIVILVVSMMVLRSCGGC